MTKSFRQFRVQLPSGDRYWTVLDSTYRTVPEVDDWLLHLRLGRARAESTTEVYATALALFLEWCQTVGEDWRATAGHLARFIFWLRDYNPTAAAPVDAVVRGERRINVVLAAVREFFRHAVSTGLVGQQVLAALYDLVEDHYLPADVRGERAVGMRSRPRHRLPEPVRTVTAATDSEVIALLEACQNARDRFIVLALSRLGNRRGEITGVRLEDVHFLPDSSTVGCSLQGPHLHVVQRDNGNGARAKSRRPRPIPADWLLVQAYDQYMVQRNECRAARDCDFLLVNLYRGRIGGPMRPRALNELLTALSHRARLSRIVTPHMLRHSFGTSLIASGSTIDEVKELLGHAYITSSEIYLHPSDERLRAAVERVGTPRGSLS